MTEQGPFVLGSGNLPAVPTFILGICTARPDRRLFIYHCSGSWGRMLCCGKVKGDGGCGSVGYGCREVEINLGVAGTPLLKRQHGEVFWQGWFLLGLHLPASAGSFLNLLPKPLLFLFTSWVFFLLPSLGAQYCLGTGAVTVSLWAQAGRWVSGRGMEVFSLGCC